MYWVIEKVNRITSQCVSLKVSNYLFKSITLIRSSFYIHDIFTFTWNTGSEYLIDTDYLVLYQFSNWFLRLPWHEDEIGPYNNCIGEFWEVILFRGQSLNPNCTSVSSRRSSCSNIEEYIRDIYIIEASCRSDNFFCPS